MAIVEIKEIAASNDDLFVSGTVDGQEIKAHGWVSAVQQSKDSATREAYLAQLLVDAAPSTTQILNVEKFLSSLDVSVAAKTIDLEIVTISAVKI
jgi:hypothetical protein